MINDITSLSPDLVHDLALPRPTTLTSVPMILLGCTSFGGFGMIVMFIVCALFSLGVAPKSSKIDTSEFDGKIQQLLNMGISEVGFKVKADYT